MNHALPRGQFTDEEGSANIDNKVIADAQFLDVLFTKESHVSAPPCHVSTARFDSDDLQWLKAAITKAEKFQITSQQLRHQLDIATMVMEVGDSYTCCWFEVNRGAEQMRESIVSGNWGDAKSILEALQEEQFQSDEISAISVRTPCSWCIGVYLNVSPQKYLSTKSSRNDVLKSLATAIAPGKNFDEQYVATLMAKVAPHCKYCESSLTLSGCSAGREARAEGLSGVP